MLLIMKCIRITEILNCENMCIIESEKYVLASRAEMYKDLLYNKPHCINIKRLRRAVGKKHGLLFGGSRELMHVKIVRKVRIV